MVIEKNQKSKIKNKKNIKIKICGITNLKDAKAAVEEGADALGFVFYKKSPRYIVPERASQIIRHLPRPVIKIGVFVNAQEKNIRRIARLCRLDMLQFHGNELPEFCARFRGYQIIKAFRIKDKINLKNISRYKTFAWLFDTFVKSKVGGTGKRFKWELIGKIDKITKPIFLSGGLTARNVREAIKVAHPNWVDVSSSVEIKPGQKDYAKVKKFIAAAKRW